MTLQQKKMPDIFVFGIVTIVDCCFFGKCKSLFTLRLYLDSYGMTNCVGKAIISIVSFRRNLTVLLLLIFELTKLSREFKT